MEVITNSDRERDSHEYERMPVARSIFSHSQAGIIITDASCRIIDANPACSVLTGYTRDEIIGSDLSMFCPGVDKPDHDSDFWGTLTTHDFWQGEICNRKKSGESYSEKLCIEVIRDDANAIKNFVAVFSDISYLKKHKDAMKKMAHHDALTGLPNRLLLAERILGSLSEAKKNEKLVAICCLDLDGFKRINDSYGHERGDKVLVEVALRLLQIVGAGDTVARPGGDEFVLLIPEISNITELEALLSRVLKCLSKPYTLQGVSIDLSASIGVAIYPLDESEADTLLRHADQAMYEAKRDRKNRIHFFDPLEEKRISEIQALQKEISDALRQEQFVLYYQPKINMRSGEVIGVEALIRWQHPEKGLLSPAEFLPAIENSHLIVEIGDWVLREAMQQILTWRNENNSLKVSVNISAMHLQRGDFVKNLSLLISEYKEVPPSLLELEILETVAFQDINSIRQIIDGCRELGVEFALDDFGTGYSSLTYLRQLPAEVIKLDRSFVSAMLNDPDDLAIVEGVLSLAKTFHRKPLAEGVETVEHGVLLLKIGCSLGQGFAIAKPMEGHAIPQWKQSYRVPDAWKNADLGTKLDLKFSILNMAVKHHSTVNRALSAIEQQVPALLPKYIHDYRNCEFGQWLETECHEHCREMPEFMDVSTKHKRIFELIKQAVDLLQSGDEQLLKSLVQTIKETHTELLDILNDFQNNTQLLQEAI